MNPLAGKKFTSSPRLQTGIGLVKCSCMNVESYTTCSIYDQHLSVGSGQNYPPRLYPHDNQTKTRCLIYPSSAILLRMLSAFNATSNGSAIRLLILILSVLKAHVSQREGFLVEGGFVAAGILSTGVFRRDFISVSADFRPP